MGLKDKNQRLVKANRSLRQEAGILVKQLEGAAAAYRTAVQENNILREQLEKAKTPTISNDGL